MRKLEILSSIFLLFTQVALGSESCLRSIVGEKIYRDLVAASPYYEFRAATKKINGIDRLVVIMGETHAKGKKAHQLGETARSHFKYYGLEGYNFGETWTGQFLAKVSDFITLLPRIGKTYTSTIDYAARDSNGKFFHLEKGHRGDWKEKAELWAEPLCLGAACAFFASAFVPVPHVITDLSNAVLIGGGSNFVTGYYLLTRFPKQEWLKTVFFLGAGPIDARNKTMAKNIGLFLDQRSNVDQVMIIVGRGHIPGIMELIKAQGFQETEKPKR